MPKIDRSDDSQNIGERLFTLGRDVLSQDVEARDRRGAVDENDWLPLWQAAADAGAFRMVLPPEYGGYGLPVLTAIRALHRLGEGCRDNGMLLGINGQLWAMQMSILELSLIHI